MFPFEQRLTEKEKKELKSNYKNLEEGYVILYLEAEFKKLGYLVSKDREKTMFELQNGKKKVFDFSLNHKNMDKSILVDLDIGSHNSTDYYAILDKTYEVTTDIYIATKDEQTLYHSAKLNCFKWIAERFNGVQNAQGKLSLHFTTLEWLILGERVWEDVKL